MDKIIQANELMENKQSEEALKILEDYLPIASPEMKFSIADVYSEWGFLEEAKQVLEGLLEVFPQESEIKIALSNIYIETRDDKQAINLLDTIEEDDPLYLEVLIQLADLYQSEGLFEVTETKLLQAKKIEPNEPVIDFALGEFFFSIGDFKRAIIYYENIYPEIESLANISISDRLAEAYSASGKYETALKMYQKVEATDPDTLFKLGFTAYHAGRNDIAINSWKEVLDQDEHYHSVYYELANVYLEEKMIEEAYKVGQAGLTMDEYNKELYFLVAQIAQQMGDEEESESLVREAIALDPDYKPAILFLIALLKDQDQYEAIISLIEETKSHYGQDPLYDWELARAHNELENYEQAGKVYEEAAINLQKDAEFLKEYGYFLTEEGQIKEALLLFKRYLALVPEDIDMIEYVERLNYSEEDDLF